jgi:arylsulfatase A-like enzyme
VKALPAPRLGAAFAVALTAMVLLWVPLTVLPILDGLLFGAPWQDISRDLAILAWLAALPSMALALLCVGLYRSMAARGQARAALWAWSLMLLPLMVLLARQAARLAWQWARTVFDLQLLLPPDLKLGLGLLVLVGTLGLLWRLNWPRILAGSVQALHGARSLTALLLIAAGFLVAWHPPSYVPMQSSPIKPSTEAAEPRPSVLLITLDAVAAADADACNPNSAVMPRLARFAQSAHCFERFYTASNFTTATTSTLETGLLPWTHHATQPDATMTASSAKHTLPGQLRAAGYRTHSITDNLLASPRHRGSFKAYDSSWLSDTGLVSNVYRELAASFPDTTLPRLMATSMAFLSVSDSWLHHQQSPYKSEHVYGDVERLLKQEAGNGHAQFIWAHTLPPHAPYLPPTSTRYKLLPKGELDRWSDMLPDNIAYAPPLQPLVDKHRLRYRESLMAADAALGDFLDRLERMGYLRNTIVVISTDHGESFELGFLGHAGPELHDALIRGPLVIRLPGQQTGARHAQPVSQADLASTLLDLAVAPALRATEGRSLRPLLEGQSLPPQAVFAMAMERQSRYTALHHGSFAIIDGDWKLVLRWPEKKVQLFDLSKPGGEAQDLAPSHPALAQTLRSRLEQALAAAEQRRREVH